MSKICTILVGVPGSGKSTWLEQHYDDETAWFMSTDDIIQDIADMYGMTYSEAFPDLIKFADKVMWQDFESSARRGVHIYVDRTNMSVKSRRRFIDRLKPYGYKFEAVVFPIPDADEWKRRISSRPGKIIPENVLQSMAGSYVEPTEAEGFSKITFMTN